MEWIKVEDTLPLDDETVILYNSSRCTLSLGWYDEEDKLFQIFDCNLPVMITH